MKQPSQPQTAPVLELRGLHKHFGRSTIIRNLSLAVQPGERVAVIGPNGAGKSTLFHLISGRLAPSAGEIVLRGQRIDGKKPHQISRLGLARSFQISQLFPRLTVLENLRVALLWSLGYRYNFWRLLSGLQDVNQRAEALLLQLHLQNQAQQLAANLAYADQRALELGITIAGNASVLLLDEPTAGMSQSETQHFVALIRQVTEGKTLLTVEHDMGVVFDLADRIAVLGYGELLAFDTPQAVRANPRVQAAYLGAEVGADVGADVGSQAPVAAAGAQPC